MEDEINEQEEAGLLEDVEMLPQQKLLLRMGRIALYWGVRCAVAYTISYGFWYLAVAIDPVLLWSDVARSGRLLLFAGFFLVFFLNGDSDV